MSDIIQGNRQEREFADQQLLSLLASLDGLTEDEKKLLALEFEHYPWIRMELEGIRAARQQTGLEIQNIRKKLHTILEGEFAKLSQSINNVFRSSEIEQLDQQLKQSQIDSDISKVIMEMIFFQFAFPGQKMSYELIEKLRSCLTKPS